MKEKPSVIIDRITFLRKENLLRAIKIKLLGNLNINNEFENVITYK